MLINLSLQEIADYLDSYLESASFPDDQNGIYLSSDRRVKRIGVALEPWKGIGEWVRRERLQALFLHRPWQLQEQELPAGTGVLSYHLAFDSKLTFGFNPRLAAILGMKHLLPFALQRDIPLGMLGDISATSPDMLITSLAQIFGTTPLVGKESVAKVQRIAVVGAMNDTFVREAAEQGVQMYLTGQWRQAAQRAVRDTAMLVVAIGHAAGEQWGLRVLAHLLRERWMDLEVVSAPMVLYPPEKFEED